MIFLIVYYRFLGLIAAGALLVYGVFLYAVVVLVPITLTLPGIAGIILTIGVASDANVVIFERVREEARAGKTPRAAVLAGYKKGITAIIDANVVTLATALILFLFASAGVKGFAFTLFVGTLLSLFTAVVATRAAFNVLAETRFLRDDRYLGLHQREIRWKMDFVGKWKLWMAITIIPMVIGAFWIGIHGLNLGLDFESGTRITTSFESQPSEQAVRDLFAGLGYTDAKIQSTTEKVDGNDVRGFQMQTETLQPPEQQELKRGPRPEVRRDRGHLPARAGRPDVRRADHPERDLGDPAQLRGHRHLPEHPVRVQARAYRRCSRSIHDVWLSLSIYSFTGREVTSATVAALLTILGYSLYDVVIVFDRIRENVPIMRQARRTARSSTSRCHETLTRSLITIAHHADPADGALLLRRGHAQGLRVRAARRHPRPAACRRSPSPRRWPPSGRSANPRTSGAPPRSSAAAPRSQPTPTWLTTRPSRAPRRPWTSSSAPRPAWTSPTTTSTTSTSTRSTRTRSPRSSRPARRSRRPRPRPSRRARARGRAERRGRARGRARARARARGRCASRFRRRRRERRRRTADDDAQEVEARRGRRSPATGPRRARPDPNRQRRHRQVQRKRRR